MAKKDKIDVGIGIIGWTLKTYSLIYFSCIVYLFFSSKETMNFLISKKVIDLNPYNIIIYAGLYSLGHGICKRMEWARKLLLFAYCLSVFIISPYRIYMRTFEKSTIDVIFCIFVILFLSHQKVKKRFTWKLDFRHNKKEEMR